MNTQTDSRPRCALAAWFGWIACKLFDHRWTTYGWTGNSMWPTHGLRCKCCGLRRTWDQKPNVAVGEPTRIF